MACNNLFIYFAIIEIIIEVVGQITIDIAILSDRLKTVQYKKNFFFIWK